MEEWEHNTTRTYSSVCMREREKERDRQRLSENHWMDRETIDHPSTDLQPVDPSIPLKYENGVVLFAFFAL